jgi:hypothetical protein
MIQDRLQKLYDRLVAYGNHLYRLNPLNLHLRSTVKADVLPFVGVLPATVGTGPNLRGDQLYS